MNIKVENSCATSYFCKKLVFFSILWIESLKEQHLFEI